MPVAMKINELNINESLFDILLICKLRKLKTEYYPDNTEKWYDEKIIDINNFMRG